jgi:hypothetical protein
MKLLKVFHETTNWFTITASFKKNVFSINAATIPFLLKFNEDYMQNNDRFKEILDIDFPIVNLSSRRRNQLFGFLNFEAF